jgi:hypothetical protein
VAHFAAPSGLLVASEGERGVENVVAVDPHGSGGDLVGDAVGFADVARPEAGGEAVHVVVGARHQLGGFGERNGHNHGTKDFFLHDLHVFSRIHQHRGLDEVSFAGSHRAADATDDYPGRNLHAIVSIGGKVVPRQGRNLLKWRIHPIADKPGIPRKRVTFQVMRRTLGTAMQGHGTMKDAQQILRHASIKTTAEIYMQEIQASVRSAINSRTREIFSQRTKELSQLKNPVSHQRKPNSLKPRNATVPNGSKFVGGVFQMAEKNGSSGRTRTPAQTYIQQDAEQGTLRPSDDHGVYRGAIGTISEPNCSTYLRTDDWGENNGCCYAGPAGAGCSRAVIFKPDATGDSYDVGCRRCTSASGPTGCRRCSSVSQPNWMGR